ncbi:MAG TPA: DUF5602 domain-containing protein [Gemmatimonadaceae bacterium]|nr:DUF5602 domain-containing protein [Gemmatimonadaceae bacterium]
MSRSSILLTASSAIALALAACTQPADTPTATDAAVSATINAASASQGAEPGVHRQYGTPQKIGNGMVRTYVVLDQKQGGAPLEVGVALSEGAMDNLPAPVPGTMNMHMFLLDMPAQNPTPYKFVQFDWNPMGHEPAGVYDLPHFDFHFYTVSKEVRASILPSDPQYAQKAASFPAPEYRAPFYIDAATPAGITPAQATVPQMGLHWLDVRSPELQGMAGNPAGFKPFTKTFIYGSWDGQFIFDEPMITRAYMLEKRSATDAAGRDEIIPVPTAQRYSPAGYYPAAYRLAWDAQAKEYRVALVQLSWRD